MPDSDLERAVKEFRRDLLARERAAASQMVRQYGEAWKRIQGQIEALTRRYYAAVARGEATSTFWLYEFERLQKIRRQVEAELYRWADAAEASIRAQQAEALRAGGREAYELMNAAGKAGGVSTAFDKLPTDAIENMIGTFQARSPVHLRLQELARQGAQAVEDGLVQGMVLGQGPRVIARNIRDALGQGLSRALVWSRTEPVRAYRSASIETYRANSEVVESWVWRSARNSRTCAACWSMDGSVHGLEEPLDDHPCGRCFAVPSLRGVPETKETGAQAFAKLTEAQQLEVLGPAKYAAWKDGQFTLDQGPRGIVGQKWDARWGSMRYERSLKEIIGIDEARKYYPSNGQKVLGYTFYKPEFFGKVGNVREVYQLGYSARGWGFYEQVFRDQYLPRFKVRDDIEWTVGLWGSPEPSYNARLKGDYRNILRLAKKWGNDFSQDGMALLIPSKGGKGGVLSWDFGRELSLGEMDRLLDGLMAVNAKLTPKDIFDFIGLTVKGRKRIEFWVRDEAEEIAGRRLIARAIKKAKLTAGQADWQGGYNFVLLTK